MHDGLADTEHGDGNNAAQEMTAEKAKAILLPLTGDGFMRMAKAMGDRGEYIQKEIIFCPFHNSATRECKSTHTFLLRMEVFFETYTIGVEDFGQLASVLKAWRRLYPAIRFSIHNCPHNYIFHQKMFAVADEEFHTIRDFIANH